MPLKAERSRGWALSNVGPAPCTGNLLHFFEPVSSSEDWGHDGHSARAEGLVRVSCVPSCPARGHFPAGLLPVWRRVPASSPVASRGRARHTQAFTRSGQFLVEGLSSTLLLSCWLPPLHQERLAPLRGTHSPSHTQEAASLGRSTAPGRALLTRAPCEDTPVSQCPCIITKHHHSQATC